jgi:hypothetical protein
MAGHRFLVPVALVGSVLLLPITATAQRRTPHGRTAPPANVSVRDVGTEPVATQPVAVHPVQVREVRVQPPVVSPTRSVERPSFDGARPAPPPSINRPGVQSFRPGARAAHGRRPSYAFRPRVSVGFGLYLGYPVVYPSLYGEPYAFTAYSSASYSSYTPVAPPRTTYSNVESVTPAAASGQTIACAPASSCGGVTFDVAPSNAQVSVDGVFVGTVEEFGSTGEPLVLAPGDHFIEVRLPCYRTASFDTTIVSGEVIPYQGDLEALRTR